MNESKKQFVDRLLAADPLSPAARGQYEKQVRAMFEKTLSRDERWKYVMAAIFMGLSGVVCCFDAVTEWFDGPRPVKYATAFFAATAVALFILAWNFFRGAWSGVVNRRTTGQWTTGVGVAFVGLLGLFSLVVVPQFPEAVRDDVRAFGLMLLIYAAVAWVRHSVLEAELRTAEKLLEIELRLADLGEAREAGPARPFN